MRRIFSLLLTVALLVSLPGCQKSSARSDKPARQLAASEAVDALVAVSGYAGQAENLEYMIAGESGDERLTVYLENVYGLTDGTWEDAAIVRAAGASAFELAVLRLEDKGAAARTVSLLESYLADRRGDFAGYVPEQADMVAGAGIAREGAYVALCVCPDPDQAVGTFRLLIRGGSLIGSGLLDILPSMPLPSDGPAQNSFPTPETAKIPEPPEQSATQYIAHYPGRCDFIQPNKDDMSVYDTSAILDAWELGTFIFLSDYDKAVYDAAKEVLDSVLYDGMNDLEKETAIYYWIVNNVDYDWTHQDLMLETPREAFTPYGGLVKRLDPYDGRMKRSAVCLGYATTFQLLMDMAGVECITVVGASESSQEDHGWNMVRLNGNWYCVDVTWDANFREYYGYPWGQESNWRYFNVTSDTMAVDHQWDYANVPEAVTRGNGRY